MTDRLRLSRRSVLKAGAGLAGLAGVPMGLAPEAFAQSGFDWKRFKGETIEVQLVKSPRGDIAQKYQAEFEDLTGIKVGSEQIPEQQQRQKATIELSSGRPSFDVVHLSFHVQKRQFAKGKWLADLRGMLNDPSMTAPDFDAADFSKPGMDYATQSDGRIDSLPWSADYWIIYWNKDLFQAKGVAYPQTFDELVKAAQALTDPKAGIYGWTSRGLKNANTPVWLAFLLGHGVDSVDGQLHLHTDGPEAIEAAKLYTKLNRECGPPGGVGFNWNECQSNFMQGRVAMWFDGIGFAPPLEDKTKSRVVGKVGYGLMPAGPKGRVVSLFGDGIGIPAASKKQGPAYFYCQWLTGKVMQKRLLQTVSGVPFRNSTFTDKETLAGVSGPKEWVQVMLDSAPLSHPNLPIIEPVTEFRDVFGVALTNMLGGADPAAELAKATQQFKPTLEKSEL